MANHLSSLGVGIPGEVQIIGYDGIVNYATGQYLCSTIVQPIPQMAELAVSLLLQPDRVPMPANHCLPVRYAPGGTTKEKLS